MSDKKQTFPRRALLLLGFPFSDVNAGERKTYMDRAGVRAVEVLSVIEGQALCRFRAGETTMVETHPVTSLASTPQKADALLAAHFAALLSRPLLQNVAGKTENSAASKPSDVTDQGAPTAAESRPEPLGGPRIRPRFSYANA